MNAVIKLNIDYFINKINNNDDNNEGYESFQARNGLRNEFNLYPGNRQNRTSWVMAYGPANSTTNTQLWNFSLRRNLIRIAEYFTPYPQMDLCHVENCGLIGWLFLINSLTGSLKKNMYNVS